MSELSALDMLEATAALYLHYRSLDLRDFDTVVSQIAPGASIERGPGVFVIGPEGMRAAMDARATNRSTCHIVMAPIARALPDGHVEIRYILPAYARIKEAGVPSSFDVDASAFMGIVDARDELVKHNDTWLIVDRTYQPAMR